MGDLSEHFSKWEFSCRCGCGTAFTMNPKLIDLLEAVHQEVGFEMDVESGFRCPAHNAAVHGGPEHPLGDAADIKVRNALQRFALLKAGFAHGALRLGVGEHLIHFGVNQALDQAVLWGYDTNGTLWIS